MTGTFLAAASAIVELREFSCAPARTGVAAGGAMAAKATHAAMARTQLQKCLHWVTMGAQESLGNRSILGAQIGTTI